VQFYPLYNMCVWGTGIREEEDWKLKQQTILSNSRCCLIQRNYNKSIRFHWHKNTKHCNQIQIGFWGTVVTSRRLKLSRTTDVSRFTMAEDYGITSMLPEVDRAVLTKLRIGLRRNCPGKFGHSRQEVFTYRKKFLYHVLPSNKSLIVSNIYNRTKHYKWTW